MSEQTLTLSGHDSLKLCIIISRFTLKNAELVALHMHDTHIVIDLDCLLS